jgi:hypothetical protein
VKLASEVVKGRAFSAALNKSLWAKVKGVKLICILYGSIEKTILKTGYIRLKGYKPYP